MWAAGVSLLTVAVAVLACESQQPTPSSWDVRAVVHLSGCLCGLHERGRVGAVMLQLLEPCGEPWSLQALFGGQAGLASRRTSDLPQPFCA